ncbi:MAG: hypothetical protein QM607_09755 [Microbacterium sp.]
MTIVLGIVLLVNAVFNVVVWPRFWTRVTTDPRARDEQGRKTTFYTVHFVLVTAAYVLAAISAVFGVWAFFL